MSEKRLLASLIGINTYPRMPLGGCVKDVLDIDLFLRAYAGQQRMTYDPCYLLAPDDVDERRIEDHKQAMQLAALPYSAPTFANVTTAAFDHLKSARDGDICLLYYSGHGSQIEAPESFWHSKPDRKNETLVCVDSRDPEQPEARDIIDKELAYLLWDALAGKKVHCLVIMDCCHSGNNTRASLVPASGDNYRYRYIPADGGAVPLEEYLGYDTGFYTMDAQGRAAIRIARYVHLAAARSSEKALETNRGGLFTNKLLESLRSGGTAKSYRELIQGLAIIVRSRSAQQNPVAYAREEADLQLAFLGGSAVPFQPSYKVLYDFNEKKWILYGGRMQGITASAGLSQTRVRITGQGLAQGVIAAVATTDAVTSILEGPELDSLDQGNEQYQAALVSQAAAKIIFGIAPSLRGHPVALAALEAAYAGTEVLYVALDFSDKAGEAEYLVRLTREASYIVTRRDDEIPLFLRERDAGAFLRHLVQVGKWLNAFRLDNAASGFKGDDFRFSMTRIEGEELDADTLDAVTGETFDAVPGEELTFAYRKDCQPAFRLEISIRNPGLAPCYVAALYLEGVYGINTSLLDPDSGQLISGGEALSLSWTEEERTCHTIPLHLEEEYETYGINENTEYLKIIVSTVPIDIAGFQQGPLEMDRQGEGDRKRGLGLQRAKKDQVQSKTDWAVFTFPMRILKVAGVQELTAGATLDYNAFSIEAPQGFSARVFAATGNDIRDKLNIATRSATWDFERLAQYILPPEHIWDENIVEESRFGAGLSANSDNGVSVLELLPRQQNDALILPEGTALIIRPKAIQQTRSADDAGLEETIIPFGYNEALQLYFPVGYADNEGLIHIETLPPETEGRIEGREALTRSVGGSVKLFFKKIFRKPATHTLSLYQPDKDWEMLTDEPGAMATILEQQSAAKIVLLIHGIFGSTKDMLESLKLVPGFPAVADFVLTWDYENLASPLPDTADKLRVALSQAGFGSIPGLSLTIVAHSMGGLVTRQLLAPDAAGQSLAAAYVKQVILAGTPNGGSEMAGLKASLSSLLTHALNITGPLKYAITGICFLLKKIKLDPGATLDAMTPGSPFLTTLALASPGVPLHILGGNTGLLKEGYTGDDFYLKKLVQAFKTGLLYPGLTTAIFGNRPNDIAVTLESMKTIAGFNDAMLHIVPNDHLSYFSEPASVQQLMALLQNTAPRSAGTPETISYKL